MNTSKLLLRRSLATMRGATGLSVLPFMAGARIPGQVPRRDPAFALAPEVMSLATAPTCDPAQLMLQHTAPVFRAGDVAKGVGLSWQAERQLGGIVRDAASGAVNEAVFRKDLMSRLLSRDDLEPEQRRAVFQRALMFWRTTADGVGRGLRKAEADPAPAASASAQLKIPRHKIAQRGLADPVQQVMSTGRRALPSGSVRIHYSKSRGGYVRAEKLPDGTWKVLGRVHSKDAPADKNAHPTLPAAKEHASSPPVGKEPVHDRAGRPYPVTMGKALQNVYPSASDRVVHEEITMTHEVFKAIRDFQVPDLVDGGRLSKGETSEGMPKPGGAGGPMQTLGGGHEKDPEHQMDPTGPEGHDELGNGEGSGDGGGLGGATKDGKGIAKGDPAANYPVAMSGAGGRTWTQGADARVLYSSVADEVIAKAVEDGTLSPEFGAPHTSPLYGLNKCEGCGAGFAKAVTVCPDCGVDRLTKSNASGARVQLTKSVAQQLLPPVPTELHFDD